MIGNPDFESKGKAFLNERIVFLCDNALTSQALSLCLRDGKVKVANRVVHVELDVNDLTATIVWKDGSKAHAYLFVICQRSNIHWCIRLAWDCCESEPCNTTADLSSCCLSNDSEPEILRLITSSERRDCGLTDLWFELSNLILNVSFCAIIHQQDELL